MTKEEMVDYLIKENKSLSKEELMGLKYVTIVQLVCMCKEENEK